MGNLFNVDWWHAVKLACFSETFCILIITIYHQKKKKKPLIIAGQKQYQLQSRIKGIEEEMGGFGKQALVNQ